jgi:outer membrane protein assembly factor BamD (BamD/ComL family)
MIPARIAVLLLATAAVGCNGTGSKKKSFADRAYESVRSVITTSYHDPESEAKLSRADELFAAENYPAAQEVYADLAENTYNSASVLEKSRFMEGECLRMRNKLPQAVSAYNRLLKDFTVGTYTEQSARRMADIAKRWLEEAIADIEQSESGKQWVRLPKLPDAFDTTRPFIDQEGELVKTLENIATNAPYSSVADWALFWAGYLHYARKRFDESDHLFSQLAEFHKDSPFRAEALKYAVISKNNSTGGAVYDGTKAAEALQLVHHIEATDPEYRDDKEKAAFLLKQKMAIRYQQAEKDFEMGEYYMRTSRPGSAFFYYDMVTRRYAGSPHAKKSEERLREIEGIRKQRAADGDKPASTWDRVNENIDGLFNGDRTTGDPRTVPLSGPKGSPLRAGPDGM